jgi:hypothetical protein
MRTKLIIIAALVIAAAPLGIIQSAMAKKCDSGAFEAGYKHGCDDSETPIGQGYTDQPRKGPAFHSQKFNEGYDVGVRDCMD